MISLHSASEAPPVAPDGVATGTTAAILAHIHDPAIHLAVWSRALPAPLARLAAQDLAAIDSIDVMLDVDALDETLPATLADAGHAPATPAAAQIASLACAFATVMDSRHLRLRLDVVDTDACHRFHADYVTARLLMTIAGDGTQWRPAAPDAPVAQLAAGDVALFKGRLWTDTPAILHRSPPFTGTPRLLLVIDPLDRVTG